MTIPRVKSVLVKMMKFENDSFFVESILEMTHFLLSQFLENDSEVNGSITPTQFFTHTKFKNASKRDLHIILKTYTSTKMFATKFSLI